MPRTLILEEWVKGQEFATTMHDLFKMMQNFMGSKTFSLSVASKDCFVGVHSLNGTVTLPTSFRWKQEDSLFINALNSETNHSIIRDSLNESIRHPHIDTFNIRAYLGIPLTLGNEMFGVLEAISAVEWDIQPSDVHAMETVGKLIVHAVELHRYSITDRLTGLYNKSQITNLIRLHKNDKFAVIIFDIDDFKLVNDGKGHTFGDQVLSCIGEVVLKSIPRSAVAFRFGGDEFCILLPMNEDCAPERVVEKIQTNLNNENAFVCSISAGIATSETATFKTIIECSDKALYEAKRKGKNQWAIWRPHQAFSS